MTALEVIPDDQPARDRAVDPRRSIIAQAPAGSGKTTLLTTRYLRLLETVDRPEEILAITFTRKAAGEMRERILAALNDPGNTQVQRILNRSAALGWGLPDQSNRLCIQTIDSFGAALIRSLPVASGHTPGIRFEERPTTAYRAAVNRVLERLAIDDDPLADDIASLFVDFDSRYEHTITLVTDMLARRDQWLDPLLAAFGGARTLEDMLRDGLEDLLRQIAGDLVTQLDTSDRRELAELAQYAAGHLGLDWPGTGLPDTAGGWRQLASVFATRDGSLRRRLTRSQGFPPGRDGAAPKQRATELRDRWRASGMESLFEATAQLPDPDVMTDLDTGLRRLATLLSLATVELTRVFEERGLMDFTELTLAARRALGSEDAPSDLALALDYRIRHLLIDEFQDTSVAQLRLFRQLVAGWQPDDGRTFFAVGDPMQSVYRFRDADVGLYMEVVRHGLGDLRPEFVRLTSNFRACGELVDWTNRGFAAAFGSVDDPVLGRIAYATAAAARPPARRPAVRFDVFAHRRAEATGLARDIGELQAHLDPTATLALLVRSRAQLDHILPALQHHEVRWRGTDIDPLAEEPVVADLVSLLHALHDPFDRLHWFALLRCPFVGLTLADLYHLARLDAPIGQSLLHAGTAETVRGLSPDGVRRLERVQPILSAAQTALGRSPTRRWLENTWLRLGGADAYAQPSALPAAERLFELLERRFPRSVDLVALQAAIDDLYADAGDVADAAATLEIMTIHKAKGLEFDHVFLPGLERAAYGGDPPMLLWRALDRGVLMGTPGSEIHDWLQYEDRQRDRHEQLRLLYVACTRAREALHLSCVGRLQDGQITAPGRNSLIHPLWATIAPEATIHDTAVPPAPVQTPDPPLIRLLADYQWQPPIDWPDIVYRDPLPAQLSASAPNPSQRLEIAVGTTVHEALHDLARTALPIELDRHVAGAQPRWSERLVELGITARDLDAAITTVGAQIRTTLADADGRWLLQPHDQAASESPFTGLVDGVVTNIVVDRTFRDDRGTRWIIDFKSSRPGIGQDLSTFVSDQLANHASQLRRYRRVLAGFDPAPTRAALYFTAIGRLVELPDSSAPERPAA